VQQIQAPGQHLAHYLGVRVGRGARELHCIAQQLFRENLQQSSRSGLRLNQMLPGCGGGGGG